MKKIISIMLTVLLLSAILANAETMYVKYANGLNLRSEACSSSELLAILWYGQQVEAGETEGEYTQVTIGEMSGYVATASLTTGKPAESDIKLTQFVSYSAGLCVRAESDLNSELVTVLENGTQVLVNEYRAFFARITYSIGEETKTGWVWSAGLGNAVSEPDSAPDPEPEPEPDPETECPDCHSPFPLSQMEYCPYGYDHYVCKNCRPCHDCHPC